MAKFTTQQIFNDAIISYMSELEGGKLKKYCETKTQAGGESITFNRIEKSKGDGTIKSMYGAGNGDDGGDMKEFKATIKYVGEQQKIKDEDMKKTTIDSKNTYVKSLSRGVMRREDKAIIDAIVAKEPQANPVEGTNVNKVTITTGYGEVASVKALIKEIKKAYALAQNTPDGHRGVALVMSASDWADLSTSDYVLKQDYAVQYGGKGEPDKFYNADIIILDDTNVGGENHKAYIIPSNAICFGEWEGSVRGDAVFVPTDGMTWHLQAIKSVGVVIAETTVITQLATA